MGGKNQSKKISNVPKPTGLEKNKKELKSIEERSIELNNREDFLNKREQKIKEAEQAAEQKNKTVLNKVKENEIKKNTMEIDLEAEKTRLSGLEKRSLDLQEQIKTDEDKMTNEAQKRKKWTLAFKKKEKDFATRDEALAIEEQEAQTGFAKKHQEATKILRKEMEDIRTKDRKDFSESLEKEKKIFQSQKDDFQDNQQKFSSDKADFEKERSKHNEGINSERLSLQSKTKMLDQEKEQVKDALRDEYESKVKSLQTSLVAKEQTKQSYEDDILELKKKIESFEELSFKFEDKEPSIILRDLKNQNKEIEKLKEELFDRPATEDLVKLDYLQEQQKNDAEKIQELLEDKSRLETENANNISSVIELESLSERLKVNNIRLDKYKSDVDELENELKKYTESPSATLESRIGVIEEPLEGFRDIRDKKNSEENEQKWLDNIFRKMEESGFKFNERLVKAFHTSLKISEWSPLTVLAGVSGTGKSELPRLYSRFGGIQFAPIAVQPNWDSSQDMFGFFNYMEQKFNPKQLLRAMAQSQRPSSDKSGFDDSILLVLLDEMNLAKIEQYFSDLLSKLELRRGQDSVAIDIDLGSGHQFPLNLGKNILYTGTMNEDESTMTLSDKAIDRSNVISFPSPRKFHQRNTVKMAQKSGLFKFEIWESWQRPVTSLPDDTRAKFKKIVEDINNRIRFAGRAIGHRVFQGIENYIANHPDVCALSDPTGRVVEENQQKYEQACQKAFEDQIVQKIMPKLRGIETEGNTKKECIEPIEKILQENAEALSQDFKNAATKGYGVFNWHTSEYLEPEIEFSDNKEKELDTNESEDVKESKRINTKLKKKKKE